MRCFNWKFITAHNANGVEINNHIAKCIFIFAMNRRNGLQKIDINVNHFWLTFPDLIEHSHKGDIVLLSLDAKPYSMFISQIYIINNRIDRNLLLNSSVFLVLFCTLIQIRTAVCCDESGPNQNTSMCVETVSHSGRQQRRRRHLLVDTIWSDLMWCQTAHAGYELFLCLTITHFSGYYGRWLVLHFICHWASHKLSYKVKFPHFDQVNIWNSLDKVNISNKRDVEQIKCIGKLKFLSHIEFPQFDAKWRVFFSSSSLVCVHF